MDRTLRDLERIFLADPTIDNLIKLLHTGLRHGQPIELTSEVINDDWENPKLQEFLTNIPLKSLRICGLELKRPLVTRTPLLAQIRGTIAEDFNYLYDVQEVQEAGDAYAGEFSIMHIAFAPNGAETARLYVVTLFNTGYALHSIEFECDWEDSQWEITTDFVAYWEGRPGLDYHEPCGDLCHEDHFGTEEHVFEVDDQRAEEVREYFEALCENSEIEDNPLLKLNVAGI